MMLAYRKYRVIKKVQESKVVVSIYLASADNLPLSEFKPGQHLMFKLYVPGHEIPAFRNYSFSDVFNPEYYRVSIKKEPAPFLNPLFPEGLCSSYLHDVVNVDDILEAKGPSGDFYLEPQGNGPVVLIAGGIGITPLLSMMKSIRNLNPDRKVYFFYGVNKKCEHSFQGEMRDLQKVCPGFRLTTFYKEVSDSDNRGVDFDEEGLINIAAISQVVPGVDPSYYICGPEPMMTFITEELKLLGVRRENIHTESFNADKLSEVLCEAQDNFGNASVNINSSGFSIHFSKVDRKLNWDDRYASILEFAEANDVEINSGCLFGDCGTCLTKITEGTIRYNHPTLVKPDAGKCLPCSCVPISNIVLEL